VKTKALLAPDMFREQQGLLDQVYVHLRSGKLTIPEIRSVVDKGHDWNRLSRVGCIMLGQVLSFFKNIWSTLPESFLQKYDGEFYEFATEEYGITPPTADRYIDIWEALFSGKFRISPPKQVNLLALPLRKLGVISSYVVEGRMNKTRWTTVANTRLNWEQMRNRLVSSHRPYVNSKNDKAPRLVLVRATGDIRLYTGGDILEVGFLNIQATDPRVTNAVRKIMRRGKIAEG